MKSPRPIIILLNNQIVQDFLAQILYVLSYNTKTVILLVTFKKLRKVIFKRYRTIEKLHIIKHTGDD